MSVDPLDDLRALRERLLASYPGDSLADEYTRNAAELAWRKVIGEDLRPETRLQISLGKAKAPSPSLAASVQSAFGDATARLARSIREPSWGGDRIMDADRANVGLVQKHQVGHLIVLAAPGPRVDHDLLVPTTATVGQQVLRAMVDLLPETADSDTALDVIQGERPAVRRAMADIAKAAAVADGIDLALIDNDKRVRASVLTTDQATVLQSSLATQQSEEVHRERHEGRLDGLRTRRRIFYLELDSHREIFGAIDQDQLDAVRRSIDRRVIATLEVRRTVDAAGRRSRPHYRLVDLQPLPEQFPQ